MKIDTLPSHGLLCYHIIAEFYHPFCNSLLSVRKLKYIPFWFAPQGYDKGANDRWQSIDFLFHGTKLIWIKP